MTPRTFEQIYAELQPSYQPSIDYLRQRQTEAPKMVESDIAAANAAQTQAYEDILTGAQRRGLVYSGIPLGEQAKYASTVYAPAILAAKNKGTEYTQNLENTILGLMSDWRNRALERRNTELDLAAQITGRGGSGDSSSATLLALLDWLRKNQDGDNTNKPSLDEIFNPQPQNPPLRVNPPSQQNLLQPSGSINIQPTAPSPQQVAPGSSIQGGAPRIQGSGARQGGSVNVNPYLTPVITNVTGPSLGLRVR